MLIENEWGGRGTGFLVMRETSSGKGRGFLVTNKHVLHSDQQQRQNATRIRVHVNKRKLDGTIEGDVIDVPLGTGATSWKEHPDRDVDVLAFDITQLINARPDIEKKWVGYDLFLTKAKITELDITIGEEVVMVGYPLGLRHRTSNFPLVRSGIVATRIGESLEDEVEDASGSSRKRILRGFLVDGATIPGSSGSPVVLKPVIGRFVRSDLNLGTIQPVLLGIIAETKYAPIQTSTGVTTVSFAGLGLAFDAETVWETIELFFPPAPTAPGGAGTPVRP